MNLNIYVLTAWLTTVTAFCVGMIVYLKNPTQSVNKRWFFMSVSITFWTLFLGLMFSSKNPKHTLAYSKILMLGANLIPITFYHFVLALLELSEDKKHKKILFIGYVATFFVLLVGFTPFFIKSVSYKSLVACFYPSAGSLFILHLLLNFGLSGHACILMYKAIGLATGQKRNQIKYVLLAYVVGFLGGSTTYPLWYEIQIPPLGSHFVWLYTLTISYAIIRYRLMDIKMAITRIGIFTVVYGLVLGVPFIAGYYTKSWLIPTAIMFILATSGPLIYTHLRRKAEDLLLVQQRRYQKTLIQAAQGMVKIKDIKKLINLIVHIVTKSVRVEFAAIFRANAEKTIYRLEAYRDKELFTDEITISHEHPLIQYMIRTQEPLLSEDIPFVIRDKQDQRECYEIFDRLRIQLIVPSMTEKSLLGFMALGAKPNNEVYTQDDINVFKILANQASLAIENCIFLEEFKKTQEKIFHADKLATVGAMAEGVSHQMNNRLQAFAAVAGDLKDVIEETVKKEEDGKRKEDLKYCLYGLDKIEKNVIHSAQIIRGILNYARTEKDASFRYMDIGETITVAIDLLAVKHNLKDFRPLVKASDGIPQVYGSPAQLSEAVFNLIDNAYEAIDDRETILKAEGNYEKKEKMLTIEFQPQERSLIVKVCDNGVGIKEENKAKMFAPFYTTKSSAKSGTGLGMYVIKRIVDENHKGKIWFESEYMKGSCFYMELPTTKR